MNKFIQPNCQKKEFSMIYIKYFLFFMGNILLDLLRKVALALLKQIWNLEDQNKYLETWKVKMVKFKIIRLEIGLNKNPGQT